MTNHIEKNRAAIRKHHMEENYIQDSEEIIFSPNQKWRIMKRAYKQNIEEYNWIISKLEIHDDHDKLRQTIFIDHQQFLHKFISLSNTDYLIFSEVLCGGNSTLNLDSFELFSFSDGSNGFICAEYYFSPDQQRLAAFGCFWACPYFIKIFDTTNIECLPWPCVDEIHLKEDGEINVEWLADREILFKEFMGSKEVQSQKIAIK